MRSLRKAVRGVLVPLGVILTELARVNWYGAEADRLYRERRSQGRPAFDPGDRAVIAPPAAKHPGEARRREASRAKNLWVDVDRFVSNG